MSGGPRPCIIFCFTFIHYAWVTWAKRFHWLVSRSVVNNYCVLRTVKAKRENKNIQQRTLSSFITIPSINYVRRKSSSFRGVHSAISWAATQTWVNWTTVTEAILYKRRASGYTRDVQRTTCGTFRSPSCFGHNRLATYSVSLPWIKKPRK